MPVYEYYCPTCKSSFEELRSMSRVADPADCPDCRGQSWKKLSVFAVGQNLMTDSIPMAGGGGGCACGGNCACGA